MIQNKKLNNKHNFLAVVHVKDEKQAIEQTKIVLDNNADGVLLINHGGGHSYKQLIEIYKAVRETHKSSWIGLNCLDLSPKNVFKVIPMDVDGIWADNAKINEMFPIQLEANIIQKSRLESGWQGLYFGGIAFKYQRPVTDLKKATEIASNYMDVVTTSGEGTGVSAKVSKITQMAEYLRNITKNNARLGIASGITPENIEEYKDAHYFLVATGISKSFFEFDPERVLALAKKIKQFNMKE